MVSEALIKFIQYAVFPGVLFVLFGVLYTMYLERKFIARIHGRIGPQYVGKAGLLQTIADLMKLLFKEWLFPKAAKKIVYIFGPIALFLIAFLPLSLIPWDPNWIVTRMNISLILAFAILAALPFISLLLGWSSGSKYALIGGYRSASQQVAFEVPLYISTVVPALLANSLDLVEITEAQHNLWFIVLNPIAAFVFFVAMLAMIERQPFDIPEAESELVFGWKTDLAAMFFGWSIFAGYTLTIAGASLFVVLFLGGFSGPYLPGIVWFFIKLIIVLLVLFVFRASLPRYRMDQLLRMSWNSLIPLSILSVILSVLLMYFGVI